MSAKKSKKRHVYDMSKLHEWGNSVQWQSIEKHTIVGWQQRIPKPGDIVLSPMASGRIGHFTITDVRPCHDPADMFFATVEHTGYTDDH